MHAVNWDTFEIKDSGRKEDTMPQKEEMVPSTCAGVLMGLLMVALRIQVTWRWEGPLGTPRGLVHWKRASSPVEAGSSGFL